MAKQQPNADYVRPEEFFRSAKPVDISRGLQEQIREQRRQTILDPQVVREQEDWSFLRDKVVGAEGT